MVEIDIVDVPSFMNFYWNKTAVWAPLIPIMAKIGTWNMIYARIIYEFIQSQGSKQDPMCSTCLCTKSKEKRYSLDKKVAEVL